MTWLVVVASIALACAAAAGVLLPFGRTGSPDLEPVDALHDERASLLQTRRELDDERATGQLSEETYRPLRGETEARTVAVLRAIEARDGLGDLPSDLRALRRPSPPERDGDGSLPARSVGRRLAVSVVGGAVIVAVLAAVIAGAVRTRSPGDPITGTLQGGLSFFEQRVAQHPNDAAARLDLAQRYLESGDVRSAVEQYTAVLDLDPRNAEAHAQLGFVLYQAGRAQDGLDAVEQALQVDPAYPEALYFKGIILLKGMDRPEQAAAAFRAYLAAAPFGAHVDEVQSLLREDEATG
jgi:TPR repeat